MQQQFGDTQVPTISIESNESFISLSARIISNNYDFINSRGADLVKELGWSNFEERRDYLLSVLIYKCCQDIAPAYLTDKLTLHSEINIRPSRHTDEATFHIPRTRTELATSAFAVQGPTVWNRIPLHIRNASSVNTFKKMYKTEILKTRNQLQHQDESSNTRPN